MDNSKKTPEIERYSGQFDQTDWSSAYCNVEKECTNIKLKLISGQVPPRLKGSFYRNGPGKLERNGQWVHHPFDGDGMITLMRFNNGEVTFSNRFVKTQAWEEEEKADKFLYRGVFGTKKTGLAISNFGDVRLKNIANTHVVKLGNKLLALWEAAGPHALDPETLETHGLSSLNGALSPKEAFSAHPRFDPGHHKDPRMVTFGVSTGPKSTIRLMEFATKGSNAGNLISDRKDSFNGFAFLHDFAITPNWAIFLQNAMDFNPLPFIIGQKGAAQCLSSKSDGKGKFWLIPRHSGSFSNQPAKIIDAPDGFVFHHLNAWEENQSVIIESIFYKDFPTIGPNEDFRNIDFNQLPAGILKRCRINLLTNETEQETLSTQCCEFAMVNPYFQGLSAKYCWMATAAKNIGNGPLQAIKKLNLINKGSCEWSSSPRGFVSEPLMVPEDSTGNEDDGWILVMTWNGKFQTNELVILNANNLSHQATLEVPIKIPYGLHGSWSDS
ncbi:MULTISPECIES: carotenoid oxygenase family protein [Prochlorococcus]|uniref:Lignostilbene-alpha, beta-dioxygenase n=1 Tax=Prochlorococcus marinus (strain SARG / CCMP1375 / SS120) TaxID=167539 RepID=Q7VDQ6_PROMA|nr:MULTISPECIES: carotenoid oxygenase family protein [Prochlorococcus]AAP99358.1 Lignostilbene-alpha, beta-dioxygenase [Prochlorococcus marinus subsp. marinus str. CCMP1375]KGG11371.1 lignostilbene-alpha [Prochlorococcus marinus str. LG]KGG18674.1 lignostilbene-alpha [Prochlorococcus marinus str. SS2]KGG22947.1 lignostilbene-alpha [Prochlorococcus marinus str. SS35]KGG34051.1 lignostilbene-alpha [Prochlorococcus marinus str. SS51]